MKQALLGVLQFFIFLLVLPIIIAATLAFQTQILGLPVHKEQWLLWGIIAFVAIYLFLYNFKEVYELGQNIVSKGLQFFAPLAAVGGLIIPIYTILIICAYLILNVLGSTIKYEGPLLMTLGFSVAMHIVLTAHQLYEADGGPIKGQYLMSFGLIGVLNLLVMALLLGLVIPQFSFIDFITFLYHHAAANYKAVYNALF